MTTCGCIKNPALCNCKNDDPNRPTTTTPMSCDKPCAPCFMNSSRNRNTDFYALMDIFYYIVGSVAVCIAAMITIWVTAFTYVRRFTIMFYNTKRSTQVTFLTIGGIFFVWILIHALLLSPSPKHNSNSPVIVAKLKVSTVKPKEVIAKSPQVTAAAKPKVEAAAKPKVEATAVKTKAVFTASVEPRRKSSSTSPQEAVAAKAKKTVGTDNISKDYHSNFVLRWLCPFFHSHHSLGGANNKKLKSRGTQYDKRKQYSKGVMASAKHCPNACGGGANQVAHPPPMSCYRKHNAPKATGTCCRNLNTCGGESSSSSSTSSYFSKIISKMKSNLKPIQQLFAKVNAPDNKLQGNVQTPINSQCKNDHPIKSILGELQQQPSSICNVLATQHDPTKQSINQIQIAVEEGRQIYNRHKWYVTFLEMKTPPALLVYLKEYILNYIGSS